MALVLAIDTSLMGLVSALFEVDADVLAPPRLLASRVQEGKNNCFTHISSLVNDVFAAAGREFAEVDAGMVGVGPGSFTGIRIGLGFVSGFFQGLQMVKPVLSQAGFSSLNLIANYFQNQLATKDMSSAKSYTFVFYPSTTTHFYWARSHSWNHVSVFRQDFGLEEYRSLQPENIKSTQWSGILDNAQVFLLNTDRGNSIKKMELTQLSYQTLTESDILAAVLASFTSFLKVSYPHEFTDKRPLGQYARLSTVEEKYL